jgi:outer membrane protein assembly factor BamD (BamD/ComL family)
MPRTNLGKNFTGLALAGLLAFLAGCASSPVPSTAARTNPYDSQGGNYAPPANYAQAPGSAPQNYSAGPPSGPPTNNPPSNYAQGNAAPPASYGTSAVMTTRYFDPNVVPAGASGVAPAGPAMVPPYDASNTPAGPPPGNAGPAPSAPMTISPVSASANKSDDDDEWDFSHLAPDYTWKKFKESVGWGPDQRLAREAYDKGQALYNAKNYDEAAKEFYTASWRWPDSTMEEDAMFLEGEAYFFSDHYASAQDSYVNLLKKHENTRYLDTVVARLFLIATYWEQLDLMSHHWPVTPNPVDKTQPWFDTFGNALACYEAVWLHDPTGPYADAALFRVANAHFRRNEWEEAAQHYDMLRKYHPKSKFQKDAHLLELQAKMRIYQGPQYSIVPLNNAEEISKQAIRQFPGQLGEDERRVRDTLQVIFEARAEREWVMAQYHDNKSEYRAAREYYKVLLEKYPRTSFGERARRRMEEIRNEPDEPPNHFAWLTNLFGKGK